MLYDAVLTFCIYFGLAGFFTMLGCYINTRWGWPYTGPRVGHTPENSHICKMCSNAGHYYQLRRK